jgi:PTS system mannose-specific IIB component
VPAGLGPAGQGFFESFEKALSINIHTRRVVLRNLVLVRIDDRLIHGQVVTAWIKHTNGNRILIIDDKLVSDRMMMRVLKAAAPPGINVEVMTIADAAALLKQDAAPDERIIILVKTPDVLEKISEGGVELKSIVIGGMGITPQRKRYNKSLSASDEEVACMKRLMQKGIAMTFQLVPEVGSVSGDKLF